MKHKHYDMIVTKAANMDLVVFSKSNTGTNRSKWSEVVNSRAFPGCESRDYFLCQPQHKEACLHWLNGGEVQVERSASDWVAVDSYERSALKAWTSTQGFMEDSLQFRIKPRKEKRWIGVWGDGETTRACKTKADVDYEAFKIHCGSPLPDIDYIEIEVEL